MRRFGKGKRKAPPSPSSSSGNESNGDAHKRTRLSAPARIKQAALAKVSQSSSSSKGLAGFAALVNKANLSAAQAETNRGLRSSSSRFRGSSAKAKEEKVEEVFTVGTIVFLLVGIMKNPAAEHSDDGFSSFHPIYCLQSDVDISSVALTGMKQSGLCVMKDTGFQFRSTDSYSVIEDQLRCLFPKLFTWISESEPDDAISSPWLICMKPPYSRKSLVVYSDDQTLPTGFDIITACQLVKSKVGLQNRVLYLVTREPVPGRVVKTWRPNFSESSKIVSASTKYVSEIDLTHTDDETFSSSSPTPSHHSESAACGNNNSEEQLRGSYTVKTDSDWDKLSARALTPPCVDSIQDPFNSSLNFIDEENPWNA